MSEGGKVAGRGGREGWRERGRQERARDGEGNGRRKEAGTEGAAQGWRKELGGGRAGGRKTRKRTWMRSSLTSRSSRADAATKLSSSTATLT